MGDSHILMGIVFVMLAVAVFMPFLQVSFGLNSTSTSGEFIEDMGQTDIGLLDVGSSIFRMFFWKFDGLPLFLDMIFLGMKAILLVLLVKIIPGFG